MWKKICFTSFNPRLERKWASSETVKLNVEANTIYIKVVLVRPLRRPFPLPLGPNSISVFEISERGSQMSDCENN